jgi:hypothetical protein
MLIFRNFITANTVIPKSSLNPNKEESLSKYEQLELKLLFESFDGNEF